MSKNIYVGNLSPSITQWVLLGITLGFTIIFLASMLSGTPLDCPSFPNQVCGK